LKIPPHVVQVVVADTAARSTQHSSKTD